MNPEQDILLGRIRSKGVGVCVVGLGYLGLPMMAVIASAGFRVIGVDVKADVVEGVSRGESLVSEPGLAALLGRLVKEGKLSATLDLDAAMKKTEITVICVQTPVAKGNKPDLSFLEIAVEGVGRSLRKGMLVIIGSTVPPGTTRRFVVPLLERLSGLKMERGFWLAHCPERISPGVALRSFTERTLLVGGVDVESGVLAAEFLKAAGVKRLVKGEVGAVEVAKTAENTFRDLNIAFANQLALICEEVGADVYEAIRLANTHERVSIHQPGAGVGGPCLTKDPHLLISPFGSKGLSAELIQNARALNDSMPHHIVDLAVKQLGELGLDISGCVVGVLGATFRGGTDDTRNSPAEEIIRSLLRRKARVLSFDPLTMESFGAQRVNSMEDMIAQAHCLIIATDHAQFRGLSLPALTPAKVIVDGRRMLSRLKIPAGIRYVAVGDLTHREA